ncbi:MAG: hypothetical protein N2053_05890 [Chitinispirillaceae bacterium]|nr:hypothetical protein [Chitinispirillaceae bacterium]
MMIKMAIAFILPFCFFLLGCGPQPQEAYSLEIPLEVGKEWNYKMTWTLDDSLADSASYKVKVTNLEEGSAGYPAYEFSESSNSMVWKEYYEKREDGLYLYAAEAGGINALWKRRIDPNASLTKRPILLVPFEFKDNEAWIYDSIVGSTDNKVEILKRHFIGIEEVNTPAGKFQCFKFETTGYNKEKRYHYYADKIGLILKEEIIDSFQINLINSDFQIGNNVYKKSVLRLSLVNYH